MNIWFVFAVWKKRNDFADIAWGMGFVLIALIGGFLNPTIRNIIITSMVVIWGIRLASHIGLRGLKKQEDIRYQKWRKEWGKYWVVRSWLQIFILQGFLILCVGASILITSRFDNSDLILINYVGIAIWLFGLIFEAIGDWQLIQFIKDPSNKGKIMQAGLWQYTRHPNYFGEVTLWWGLWLAIGGVPYFWLAIIGPITITFLILKVSGIPMLEKQFEGNKEFEQYKKTTNAFFPWFPKKIK
jgi:steroid 5-alpha reductase family enzyme